MDKCASEKKIIKKLRKQIRELKNELSFFRGLQTKVTGSNGEDLIKKISQGNKTLHNAPHDIITTKGTKIEVKTVRCLPANNRVETPCCRWSWRYVLRRKKKEKDYEYLILIGDKDRRYKQNNLDRSPYVFFLLSKRQVKNILSPKDSIGQINLTTNFETVRSKQGRELLKYRKSIKEIEQFLKRV